MLERNTTGEKVNGKPFAFVDDRRVSHLGGDWSNPVGNLIEKDKK